MADETPSPPDRRTRELARRTARRRRVNVVTTVLTLAVVALVALVATDTLRVSAGEPSLAKGRTVITRVTAPSNPSHEIESIKRNTPPRPLSNAAPLRLWIGGDSLSGELGFQL